MFALSMLLSSVLAVTIQAAPAADRPPDALRQLHDSAIAVFDAAQARNWPNADDRLQAVADSASELPSHLKPALARQLDGRLRALRRSVHDRSAARAMTNANWIARITDELSSVYESSVPVDVRLLPFYGRQLEIEAATGRHTDVSRTVGGLHTLWRRVEPLVLQRNGVDAARRFTDVVVRADAARSSGELAQAGAAEVAASAGVRELFQPRATGR